MNENERSPTQDAASFASVIVAVRECEKAMQHLPEPERSCLIGMLSGVEDRAHEMRNRVVRLVGPEQDALRKLAQIEDEARKLESRQLIAEARAAGRLPPRN